VDTGYSTNRIQINNQIVTATTVITQLAEILTRNEFLTT